MRKKKSRALLLFNIIAFSVVVIGAVLLCIFVFFKVGNVTFTSDAGYDEADIRRVCGINEGDNLVLLETESREKALEHREPPVGGGGTGLAMAVREIGAQVRLAGLQQPPPLRCQPAREGAQIATVGLQGIARQPFFKPQRVGEGIDAGIASARRYRRCRQHRRTGFGAGGVHTARARPARPILAACPTQIKTGILPCLAWPRPADRQLLFTMHQR